jgi:bacterioferritin-associated ferredoxin
MYICICKGVTDSQIKHAVQDEGVRDLRGVRRELGACDQCGKCALAAKKIIRDTLKAASPSTSERVRTAA